MHTHARLVLPSLLLLVGIAAPRAHARAQAGTDSASSAAPARAGMAVATSSYAGRIPVGASAYVLDSTEIMASTAENLSAVLQARVPGLSVLRPGGSAAEGSRVRLRGPNSLLIASDPIVIVDGIRVNAMQESSVLDVGVRTSRLDDIMPEDIARIEVLPGPAAASLFGPGAAGGALIITTKRGDPGALRWSARAESRLGMKPGGFPANYHRTGIATGTGQPAASCSLAQVASGACTPTGLQVFNPLEQAAPFRTARAASGHLSLAGGIGHTLARLSATGRRTLGVLDDDDDGRLGLSGNLVQRIGDAIDIGVHGGYTRTSAGLPLSGNSDGNIGSGVIASGLFGAATDDATAGFRYPSVASGTRQRATHRLAGASATWRATSWLTGTAVYGRDQLDLHDRMHRTISGFPVGTTLVVDRWGDLTHATTTTGGTFAASYPPTGARSIGGQTSIGYERLGSAFAAADSQPFRWSRAQQEWTSSGPWIHQQITWRDRLFVGGALRWERRKVFGAKAPSAWFKSADASWSLGDIGRLETVRLRAAYGEGGSWTAGNPGVLSTPGGLFNDVSTAEPKERTDELEMGLDGNIGDRVAVGLTAFRSNASKLYIMVFLPPSIGGFPGPVGLPVAGMRNEGLEVSASARMLDHGSLRWDAALNASVHRNRVRSLGEYPPIIELNGRSVPGYPAGGYWSTPYTYADADQNGIIEASEVQTGNEAVFIGSSLPTREVGLRSTLSLGSRFTVGALLDYRGGHKLANANERIRCRSIENCRAAQDPAAPLADQAAVVANRSSSVSVDPYIEDASFLKLRELSLAWNIPPRWSSRIAGTNAAVTLAGRNLVTWTHYKGLDPELDYRPSDALPRGELGKTPLVREIVLRLDVRGGAR